MKKYPFLAIAIFGLCSFECMSQTGGLKGPKAKNHKVWQQGTPNAPVSVAVYPPLKGPKAKNTRLWKIDSKHILVVYTEPKDLKGPEAKNAHHFKTPERKVLTYARSR